jgi:hypothetical protein
LAGQPGVFDMDAPVSAAREHAGDVGVTIHAGFVASVSSPWNLRRSDYRPVETGAGIE